MFYTEVNQKNALQQNFTQAGERRARMLIIKTVNSELKINSTDQHY